MRKIFIVMAFIFLSAGSAKAQVELFGGYSFERFNQTGLNANQNGWDVSLNYKVVKVAGIVGDFSRTYGSPSIGSTNLQSYLFGPQFSFPAPVSPFFHVMFGAGHADVAGAGETSFATAIGGGIDIPTAPHISIRAIQIDDIITRFASATQNNPRISAGIVVHF
jgi:hypothetical protein